MHVKLIQFTASETQNYPSVNNYCSDALSIDVVTKQREGNTHKAEVCITRGGIRLWVSLGHLCSIRRGNEAVSFLLLVIVRRRSADSERR